MILSTVCYLEQDGKYLMLHRIKKENDINREKWIGIGGKFEEGESPEDCITREFREETGLQIKDLRLCGIISFVADDTYTEHMVLFHADGYEGEITECDEGELAWIDKKELRKKDLWAGDHLFLDLMEEGHPFFSMKLVYHGKDLLEAYLNGKKITL